MNNGTFAGRCLECNGSVSMRVKVRESIKHPKVWTGICVNGHKLRLEIITHLNETYNTFDIGDLNLGTTLQQVED